VETEAEEDSTFLEDLITELTAKDPLTNRLAQLNEHIGNIETTNDGSDRARRRPRESVH
jgi:hypothetical protein